MSYPWKRDPAQLPDNQVQVQKKLEITEAQLIKQPETGKAYDDQMKDMEDRGFREIYLTRKSQNGRDRSITSRITP